MSREWKYWTRNKLAILADYLPAFNAASAKSPERVYIDLMAGEPANVDKDTGESIDGSARVAMAAKPAFTRLVFCERDARRAPEPVAGGYAAGTAEASPDLRAAAVRAVNGAGAPLVGARCERDGAAQTAVFGLGWR